ncbi:MAG: rod shape-determining protein MreD [Ferrovum sp. 37-45-19]|jgi:rod shape-determining protein MreD|uniref:rod shape-determining protein MreD n=1 Tax=Ferrovum sp. JA12 TaxID=1356299 RepID=UPI000702D5B5|nr:rod shape-determining protein MreD [Ferrovum sp. JA12]KRH79251.1 Rod shape-determining protein MreD [Ferrovum sp. JA12]OYV80528.1 MAG: rod shape-determining protein MreD [Ferrovum sp. 21-44-67]OYV94843.1 MAG: rod shape-determining protein MreD [Ferrovum sp. 37-45-19]HQU06159.1 rod shape-determining protein MreD [Ferrovaceae bacterium]
MLSSAHRSIKKPAPMSRIILTLVASVVLTLLPWSGYGQMMEPSWILIVLLYWGLHEPRVINGFAFFVLGLISDVAQSSILGIHALSFSLILWLLSIYRQRILTFYAANQAIHLLPAFFLNQLIITVVVYVTTDTLPHILWFTQSLLSALCWLITPYVLEAKLSAKNS